jgi:hypothetical protein
VQARFGVSFTLVRRATSEAAKALVGRRASAAMLTVTFPVTQRELLVYAAHRSLHLALLVLNGLGRDAHRDQSTSRTRRADDLLWSVRA